MENANFATPFPPPQPAPQPGGWLSRNWKWAVPVAVCVVFLLVAAFVVGVMAVILTGIKSSDAYQQALAKARTSPAVVERLGSPVQDTWWFTGTINVNGSAGDADLQVPIHGPKGKGTLYAVGKKSAGQWTFTTLQVETEGSPDRIDLLLQEQ